ncbi:bifunctional diguanylate cyclase/phosphodiesterase [Ideonella sp. A 288]|uniref:putative bifunctional diguanylate cyclase/phosphodiesterase n=1 Tax=Ideonella sp. A 288 TaxID=1962181 RepID=UPI001303B1C1|nr:GGDEF and EAL domain-containing protein [Ideonella sp. A 288]
MHAPHRRKGDRRQAATAARAAPQAVAPPAAARDDAPTDLQALRDECALLRQRLQATLDGTMAGTWDWHWPSGALQVDARFAEIVGLILPDLQALGAADWHERVHTEDRAYRDDQIQRHLRGELSLVDVECRVLHREGHWVWVHERGRVLQRDADGQPLTLYGTLMEITERKELEHQLFDAAHTDRLTRLPNRAMLLQRLELAVAFQQVDPDERFALLFLDFDRFKKVNDTLGHAAGDELLQQIAQRLRGALRVGDVHGGNGNAVARFGGDEFVVLLRDARTVDDAARVAARLLEVFSAPYQILDQEVHSSASIGIVMGEADGRSAEDLLRDADIAMYEAKRAGRATAVFFDPAMHQRLARAQAMEAALRHAIARREFRLVYQPIVDLQTGATTSVEALLRWRHPELGSVSPSEFIPIAEESSLILPVGEWVLHEACRQWMAWHRTIPERTPAVMSVNLSRVQMHQGDRLIAHVQHVLDDTGMPPSRLQLEVTEREVMRDPTHARALMDRLRAMGLRLAMDDFGTGTSSLGCLRDYPFDVVKIDKSFVDGLVANPDVLAVIHATVTLIENLGMASVAEGIEDPAQAGILQSIGCRYGQGYLFSRPVPAQQLPGLQMAAPLPA